MPIIVLISSVSKKVPLLKAVRKALHKIDPEGKIIGGDSNPNCIASYFLDEFWEMPPLQQTTADEVISWCVEHRVNCLIPTRDGELPFYSFHRDDFAKKGIRIMISETEQIATCTDKLLFYKTLSNLGLPVIATSLSLDDIEAESYVVKERFGAGSRSIGLNLSKAAASKHAKTLHNPIFQKFVKGEEISVDLYLNQYAKSMGGIVRKRDFVVDGESQITTSLHLNAVDEMCTGLAEKLELYGHVMFQLIRSEENGSQYFLECNPRFGGASTLSIEMGLDSFYWFFLEVAGEDLSKYPFHRSEVEKQLVRYPEDLILQ
jgi:carbamoyl-phosphate synthase large subunit